MLISTSKVYLFFNANYAQIYKSFIHNVCLKHLVCKERDICFQEETRYVFANTHVYSLTLNIFYKNLYITNLKKKIKNKIK